MAKFITSEPFAGLAKQLKGINVDRTVRNALAEAGDEYAEVLQDRHQYAGADEPHVNAIRAFREGDVQAAGVPDNSPHAKTAFAFEYGDPETDQRPSGIFRLEEAAMARHASQNLAAMLTNQIGTDEPAPAALTPMQQRLLEDS